MLALLINAALLVAQQAQSVPVTAAYQVHGGGEDQIERLLDEWEGTRTIRRAVRPPRVEGLSQCVAPRHPRTVDLACVRGLIARPGRRAPTVAIISVDAGRVNVVYNVSCVGPDGVGRAQLNPNVGPFSRHTALRDRARADLARCLSAALRGSIAASRPAGPAAALPPAAAFLIEAPHSRADWLGLHRLVFQSWRDRGGVQPLEQRVPLPNWSSCVSGRPARLDPQCVQRLLPRRDDRIPVVALIVLPSPDRFYRLRLHCVGARGAGSTSFTSGLDGIYRSNRSSRLSNNYRSGIARCINEAAPGTVIGDTW